jgi:hypothetical protein
MTPTPAGSFVGFCCGLIGELTEVENSCQYGSVCAHAISITWTDSYLFFFFGHGDQAKRLGHAVIPTHLGPWSLVFIFAGDTLAALSVCAVERIPRTREDVFEVLV